MMRIFFYVVPILFLAITITLAGCARDAQIDVLEDMLETVATKKAGTECDVVACQTQFCGWLDWLSIPHRNINSFMDAEVIDARLTVPIFSWYLSILDAMAGPSPSENMSWHERYNWKAEEFFDDPQVIALCKAIEAGALEEIDRLVAEGADVNVRGKDNMTPLLWAFPGDNLESFKRLLEHGADPNVVVTDHFNTRRTTRPLDFIEPGDSVLRLAARTREPAYFRYVMQYGGDPNLTNDEMRVPSPLMRVIIGWNRDKRGAIQLLIDAGADLDYRRCSLSLTALSSTIPEYSLTLQLLEAGASFNIPTDRGVTFVHHFLRTAEQSTPEWKEGYAAVLAWLEANGADIEGAREDIAVWAQGGRLSPERLAEIRQRYADERAARQAAREQEPPEL